MHEIGIIAAGEALQVRPEKKEQLLFGRNLLQTWHISALRYLQNAFVEYTAK